MTDCPVQEKVAAAYQRLKQEMDKIVSMAASHICAAPIGNGIRLVDPSYSAIHLAARRAIAILTALQEQQAEKGASDAELLAENQALRDIEATKRAAREAGFTVMGGHVPRGPYYSYSGPYRVQPPSPEAEKSCREENESDL